LVFIYSLPKASRLTKTEQFSAVFHANSAETGTTFQVLVKPTRQETARLGIVLGKRVTPRAVDRNYVKRLIREEFRMRKHSLGGMDVVVKLLKHLSKAQARQARTELSDLFSKVSRWAA
jgi:ribonuclease P protein component